MRVGPSLLLRPFEPGLDDESLIETSYQFQLSKNFSLTPNFQIIFNPAGYPGESSINVLGYARNTDPVIC